MSWREDRSRLLSSRHKCILAQNHTGMEGYARARDRNHSRSSGGGSMYVQNPSDPVRARQVEQEQQSVIFKKPLIFITGKGFSLISSVLK